jgi:hypothetical protein
VIARKSDRARILGDVVQPQRRGLSNQDAQDPAAARQLADRRVRLGVDAGREEALESASRAVDHAESRILRVRQVGCGLDDALEENVERELGRQRDPRVDEDAQAVDLRRRLVNSSRSLGHAAVVAPRAARPCCCRASVLFGDGSDELSELRGACSHEHGWRVREGLVHAYL